MTSPSRPAVIYVAGEPVYLEQRCVPCLTCGGDGKLVGSDEPCPHCIENRSEHE